MFSVIQVLRKSVDWGCKYNTCVKYKHMAFRFSSMKSTPGNSRHYNNRGQQEVFAINGQYYLVYWCIINNQ